MPLNIFINIFGCFSELFSAERLVNCSRKATSNRGSRKLPAFSIIYVNILPLPAEEDTDVRGKKYSIGVRNRTSTLLEHCLAKTCQTCILLGT